MQIKFFFSHCFLPRGLLKMLLLAAPRNLCSPKDRGVSFTSNSNIQSNGNSLHNSGCLIIDYRISRKHFECNLLKQQFCLFEKLISNTLRCLCSVSTITADNKRKKSLEGYGRRQGERGDKGNKLDIL